jgi:hypothetical protein
MVGVKGRDGFSGAEIADMDQPLPVDGVGDRPAQAWVGVRLFQGGRKQRDRPPIDDPYGLLRPENIVRMRVFCLSEHDVLQLPDQDGII